MRCLIEPIARRANREDGCKGHFWEARLIGAITGPPPAALARLGPSADRWQRQVLAVGAGYFRAIGAADILIEKAREIGQLWLRGVNRARQLEAAR